MGNAHSAESSSVAADADKALLSALPGTQFAQCYPLRPAAKFIKSWRVQRSGDVKGTGLPSQVPDRPASGPGMVVKLYMGRGLTFAAAHQHIRALRHQDGAAAPLGGPAGSSGTASTQTLSAYELAAAARVLQRVAAMQAACSPRTTPHLLCYSLAGVGADQTSLFLTRPWLAETLSGAMRRSVATSVHVRQWLAFQLLRALTDAHRLGFTHGSLSPENCGVDSSWWLTLTDWGFTKPAVLPDNEPAAHAFYFETGLVDTTYTAPERFVDPDTAWRSLAAMVRPSSAKGQHASAAPAAPPARARASDISHVALEFALGEVPGTDDKSSSADTESPVPPSDGALQDGAPAQLQPQADVFGAGIVIGELFLGGGTALLDYAQALALRAQDVSAVTSSPSLRRLARQLEEIDPRAKVLVADATHPLPHCRPSASQLLQEHCKPGAIFPPAFDGMLWPLSATAHTPTFASADARIALYCAAYSAVTRCVLGVQDLGGEALAQSLLLPILAGGGAHAWSSVLKGVVQTSAAPPNPELGFSHLLSACSVWSAQPVTANAMSLASAWAWGLAKHATGQQPATRVEFNPAVPAQDAAVLNVVLQWIASQVRHCTVASSRLAAVWLLARWGTLPMIASSTILDVALPAVLHCAEDACARVRAMACAALTALIGNVRTVPVRLRRYSRSLILPRLNALAADAAPLVACTMSQCTPQLLGSLFRLAQLESASAFGSAGAAIPPGTLAQSASGAAVSSVQRQSSARLEDLQAAEAQRQEASSHIAAVMAQLQDLAQAWMLAATGDPVAQSTAAKGAAAALAVFQRTFNPSAADVTRAWMDGMASDLPRDRAASLRYASLPSVSDDLSSSRTAAVPLPRRAPVPPPSTDQASDSSSVQPSMPGLSWGQLSGNDMPDTPVDVLERSDSSGVPGSSPLQAAIQRVLRGLSGGPQQVGSQPLGGQPSSVDVSDAALRELQHALHCAGSERTDITFSDMSGGSGVGGSVAALHAASAPHSLQRQSLLLALPQVLPSLPAAHVQHVITPLVLSLLNDRTDLLTAATVLHCCPAVALYTPLQHVQAVLVPTVLAHTLHLQPEVMAAAWQALSAMLACGSVACGDVLQWLDTQANAWHVPTAHLRERSTADAILRAQRALASMRADRPADAGLLRACQRVLRAEQVPAGADDTPSELQAALAAQMSAARERVDSLGTEAFAWPLGALLHPAALVRRAARSAMCSLVLSCGLRSASVDLKPKLQPFFQPHMSQAWSQLVKAALRCNPQVLGLACVAHVGHAPYLGAPEGVCRLSFAEYSRTRDAMSESLEACLLPAAPATLWRGLALGLTSGRSGSARAAPSAKAQGSDVLPVCSETQQRLLSAVVAAKASHTVADWQVAQALTGGCGTLQLCTVVQASLCLPLVYRAHWELTKGTLPVQSLATALHPGAAALVSMIPVLPPVAWTTADHTLCSSAMLPAPPAANGAMLIQPVVPAPYPVSSMSLLPQQAVRRFRADMAAALPQEFAHQHCAPQPSHDEESAELCMRLSCRQQALAEQAARSSAARAQQLVSALVHTSGAEALTSNSVAALGGPVQWRRLTQEMRAVSDALQLAGMQPRPSSLLAAYTGSPYATWQDAALHSHKIAGRELRRRLLRTGVALHEDHHTLRYADAGLNEGEVATLGNQRLAHDPTLACEPSSALGAAETGSVDTTPSHSSAALLSALSGSRQSRLFVTPHDVTRRYYYYVQECVRNLGYHSLDDVLSQAVQGGHMGGSSVPSAAVPGTGLAAGLAASPPLQADWTMLQAASLADTAFDSSTGSNGQSRALSESAIVERWPSATTVRRHLQALQVARGALPVQDALCAVDMVASRGTGPVNGSELERIELRVPELGPGCAARLNVPWLWEQPSTYPWDTDSGVVARSRVSRKHTWLRETDCLYPTVAASMHRCLAALPKFVLPPSLRARDSARTGTKLNSWWLLSQYWSRALAECVATAVTHTPDPAAWPMSEAAYYTGTLAAAAVHHRGQLLGALAKTRSAGADQRPSASVHMPSEPMPVRLVPELHKRPRLLRINTQASSPTHRDARVVSIRTLLACNLLVVAHLDGMLRAWPARLLHRRVAPQPLATWHAPAPITTMCVDELQRAVMLGCSDGSLHLVSVLGDPNAELDVETLSRVDIELRSVVSAQLPSSAGVQAVARDVSFMGSARCWSVVVHSQTGGLYRWDIADCAMDLAASCPAMQPVHCIHAEQAAWGGTSASTSVGVPLLWRRPAAAHLSAVGARKSTAALAMAMLASVPNNSSQRLSLTVSGMGVLAVRDVSTGLLLSRWLGPWSPLCAQAAVVVSGAWAPVLSTAASPVPQYRLMAIIAVQRFVFVADALAGKLALVLTCSADARLGTGSWEAYSPQLWADAHGHDAAMLPAASVEGQTAASSYTAPGLLASSGPSDPNIWITALALPQLTTYTCFRVLYHLQHGSPAARAAGAPAPVSAGPGARGDASRGSLSSRPERAAEQPAQSAGPSALNPGTEVLHERVACLCPAGNTVPPMLSVAPDATGDVVLHAMDLTVGQISGDAAWLRVDGFAGAHGEVKYTVQARHAHDRHSAGSLARSASTLTAVWPVNCAENTCVCLGDSDGDLHLWMCADK